MVSNTHSRMIFLADPFAPFAGQPAHAMLHGLVQDGLVSAINYLQRLLQTAYARADSQVHQQ